MFKKKTKKNGSCEVMDADSGCSGDADTDAISF